MLTFLRSLALLIAALVAGCETSTTMLKPNDSDGGYSVSKAEITPLELKLLLPVVRSTVDCLLENSGNVCGLKFNIFRLDRDLLASVYFSESKIQRIFRESDGNEGEVIVEFPWANDGSGYGVLFFERESGKFVPKDATVALP